jgi:putative oxygen-independent coproporphyrinogen III oxidase
MSSERQAVFDGAPKTGRGLPGPAPGRMLGGAMSSATDDLGLGVYVHFPWCLRKCGYCDFLSAATDRSAIPHARYADAVIAELEARLADVRPAPLRSIYVGGGTPSLWNPRELGRVLDALTRHLSPTPDLEITVECNPSSFDLATAQALRTAGATRVSLGVQSLDDDRLAFLERLHDARSGLAAVAAALAAGIPRVSADLIYGISGQSAEAAADEARRLADLGPTHLSAYTLTIEPATPFAARARQGHLPLLAEDAVAESFLAVDAALTGQGFDHYEISNFAREGHVSRHNLGYWLGHDYLGLGCGAWGTVTLAASGERLRYRNTPRPAGYLDTALARPVDSPSVWRATSGGLVSETESIAPETALSERLMLGLRLARGVDLERAARQLGVDPWPPARHRAAQRLLAAGRLAQDGPRLWIPRDAWLLADGVIRELL